ncbi:MAG: ECF-type sigma factor [Acidobacteriota bacterium]
MADSIAQPLTTLLDAARAGQSEAFDRVFAQVYDELRRLAHVVRAGRGATLDTTALVHEAYLKLAGAEALAAQNRLHFMRIAARAMRQVLVNAAERRTAAKRGGGQDDVTFDERDSAAPADAADLLALHQALTRLEVMDPRQAQIVECRYFAGLTIPETAGALAVSVPTVNREWRLARAWLARTLGDRALADE